MNNNNSENQTNMYINELRAIYEEEVKTNRLKRFESIQDLREFCIDEIALVNSLSKGVDPNYEEIKAMYIIGLQGIEKRITLQEDLDNLVQRLNMLEDGIVKEIDKLLLITSSTRGKNIIDLLKINSRYYLK